MATKKQSLLKEYKIVSDFVDSIADIDHTVADTERHIDKFLAKVAAKGFELIPALIEKIKRDQNKLSAVNIVSQILKQYDNEEVLEEVILLFIDPATSDEVRASLLEVMAYYEIDTSDPEIRAHFQDIEAIHDKVLDSMLDQLVEHEELASEILIQLSPMPTEMKQALITEVAGHGAERALPLLALFAEYPDSEVADVAIQALGSIRSPRSIWLLENLVNNKESLKNSIDRSRRKLQFAGVEPEAISPPKGKIHECLLSNIDGRGNRMLFISRKVGRGKYEMVNLMLNEQSGIKDCMSASELNTRLYKDLISHIKMEAYIASVDYDYAVKLVQDALWWAKQNKEIISPAFILKRSFFGDSDLTPTPYESDLEKWDISTVREQAKELLQETEELVGFDFFSSWWIDTEESYQFVKNKMGKRRRGMVLSLVPEFIKKVIEPARKTFIRRLVHTIEFMGKDDPEENQLEIELALVLYIALVEWGSPCKDIPFFFELADITLDNVRNNIELGIEGPESDLPDFE